jgi:hypothetical protein
MNNFDIIVLTGIVVISFLIFIVLSAREFNSMSRNEDNKLMEKR